MVDGESSRRWLRGNRGARSRAFAPEAEERAAYEEDTPGAEGTRREASLFSDGHGDASSAISAGSCAEAAPSESRPRRRGGPAGWRVTGRVAAVHDTADRNSPAGRRNRRQVPDTLADRGVLRCAEDRLRPRRAPLLAAQLAPRHAADLL